MSGGTIINSNFQGGRTMSPRDRCRSSCSLLLLQEGVLSLSHFLPSSSLLWVVTVIAHFATLVDSRCPFRIVVVVPFLSDHSSPSRNPGQPRSGPVTSNTKST